MNPNLNIAEFIDQQDTAVATALVAGIGNFALSQTVNAAVAQIYIDMANERDPDRDSSLDDRNDKDDTLQQRDPPVGLENREPPLERANRYGALYVGCVNRSVALGAGQWDQPQDVPGHVLWRAGQPAKDKLKAGRTTDLTEALRIASRAKAQQDFWNERKDDILAIVTDATDYGSEPAESALFALTGVDAVQAMVKGYGRLVDRIGNRKTSPYFTAKGPIGDELRSDVGAMEAGLKKVEEFITTLEAAYAHEVLEAINLGRRLDTIESVAGNVEARQRARLAEYLAG